MNRFLIILCATTLSSAVLFLSIIFLDRHFHERIYAKQAYLLMKISLLYFFTPGLVIGATYFKLYTHRTTAKVFAEIKYYYYYDSIEDMALEFMLSGEFVVMKYIFIIWLLGAVLFYVIKEFYRIQNLRKLLKTCIKIEEEEVLKIVNKIATQYKIKSPISVYRTDSILSPFLTGWIRPKIILPNMKFSAEEVEIIFRHELTHYKNKDIIFRSLIAVAEGINWFNPLIRFFSHTFYDYGELACDEVVAGELTKNQKSVYAHLLIELYESSDANTVSVAFSKQNEYFFRRRILIIMKKTEKKRRKIFSTIAVSAMILCCPLISYGSSEGAVQIYKEIAGQFIGEAHQEQSKPANKNPYYCSKTDTENFDMVLPPIIRGITSVDTNIQKGKGASTDQFTATAGQQIRIMVTGDSDQDSFTAGIMMKSGESYYVDSEDGAVYFTFDVKKNGTYYVYFENTGNKAIHLMGTVYVN